MKRRSYPKSWGRLFERYCAQFFPDRKEEICERADRKYAELMKCDKAMRQYLEVLV